MSKKMASIYCLIFEQLNVNRKVFNWTTFSFRFTSFPSRAFSMLYLWGLKNRLSCTKQRGENLTIIVTRGAWATKNGRSGWRRIQVVCLSCKRLLLFYLCLLHKSWVKWCSCHWHHSNFWNLDNSSAYMKLEGARGGRTPLPPPLGLKMTQKPPLEAP